LACGKTFCWNNKGSKRRKEKAWFSQWITEGYSVKQLNKHSSHSPGKVRGIISDWLNHRPLLDIDLSKVINIICDGTFIEGRRHGIYAVMNAKGHSLVSGVYDIKEKVRELIIYFNVLKQMGLNPKSATIDGKPGISQALEAVWPGIIIQRCLVHIQRQGLMWCRIKPKRTDAKRLRKLLLTVTGIKTAAQAKEFINTFKVWEQRHGKRLMSTKVSGWVASDLVRARSMVIKALPNMFFFLKDSRIPSTSNAIEGYFSRLKEKYYRHRGLARRHRVQYFDWYFHLVKR